VLAAAAVAAGGLVVAGSPLLRLRLGTKGGLRLDGEQVFHDVGASLQIWIRD